MKPITVILEAWKYLQCPEHWSRHTMARNKDGRAVSSKDPNAVAFCMLGALVHFSPNDSIYMDARMLIDRVMRPNYKGIEGYVPNLNDECETHTEFIGKFEPIIRQISEEADNYKFVTATCHECSLSVRELLTDEEIEGPCKITCPECGGMLVLED